MTAITNYTLKNIIKKLLNGEDYRVEVVNLINETFLNYAIDFFKQVAIAKLENQNISEDWYKEKFLNQKYCKSDDIAIHAGLNKKTIHNMYQSATKEIILDASNEHYEILSDTIKNLIEHNSEIDLLLTIKLRQVSIDLNINESLLVINILAVKRSALRGGLWSKIGKNVEKPLMIVLCQLFQVPEKYYNQSNNPKSTREVDFYLFSDNQPYRTEVKLMGTGNPESADGALARDSHVFIADSLSEQNKTELAKKDILWVELRNQHRYKQFEDILKNLKIPYTSFDYKNSQTLNNLINSILEKTF